MTGSSRIDLHAHAKDAMRARGFEPDFTPAAIREAQRRPSVDASLAGDVRDMRQLTWFSIDNDDTRDLDQLSVAEELPGGVVRVLVAIADVDVFVAKGGAIDARAALNTTSVYTAAGVFPMLPEVLSNDLSSLHEGQDRAAVVVDLRVDSTGALVSSDIYRAVVSNRAKLAYSSVSAWLDDAAPLPAIASVPGLEAQLRLHDLLATRLRERRQQHGALNLGSSSARAVFKDGRLVDLQPDARNRAKDIIADLMIAANGATARYLSSQGFPTLRRFLQAPRRWDRLEALAAQHGFRLPDDPDAVALDKFLRERRRADPAGFADLSLSVVKMLGSGEYSAMPAGAPGQGHFGLAVNDYAHSTAPNRRYPDLVTQRLLKAAMATQPAPYSFEELEEIARHCTTQEDNAAKVERQVLKAAGAFLLHDRIGEVFDAVVTGASGKGTFVRIARPMLEGRLVQGFEGADVGDALRVQLVSVDAGQSFIDFERA